MSILRKIKTVSGTQTLNDLGIVVGTGYTVLYDESDKATSLFALEEIVSSQHLATAVASGTIIVNDGSQDLSSGDGLLAIASNTLLEIENHKVADDHPQYLLTSGARAVENSFTINGNLTVSGTTISGSQLSTLIDGSNSDSLHIHSAEYVTFNGENVKYIIDSTAGHGFIEIPTVTDTGGLNIEWTGGLFFDHENGVVVTTLPGSGTCTNDSINYLVCVDENPAQLEIAVPLIDAHHVVASEIYCAAGEIWNYHSFGELKEHLNNTNVALAIMFPMVVINGFIVSEEVGGDPFNVVMSSGTAVHDGFFIYTLESNVASSVTPMVRWYHSGGNWAYDTSTQIDATQYDNGTDLVALPSNEYAKSVFYYFHGLIHWVYPQATHSKLATAQVEANPVPPPF